MLNGAPLPERICLWRKCPTSGLCTWRKTNCQPGEYPRQSLTWVRDLGGYRRTLTHGDEINVDLDHWRRTRTVEPPSYESELETTAYFGTPEQCVQRITKLRDEYGIGYFGASMSFGEMEHSRVLRSMELFAKEVMPKFR